MDMPQTLLINHHLYTAEQMSPSVQGGRSWLQEHFASAYGVESFELKLADFLAEWFNDSPLVNVMTSGSTGVPKRMQVSKEKMLNSARMTVEFLKLQAKDTAYLCMPLQYIAGKMMVVRALQAGLDLIVREPCGRPLQPLLEDNESAPVFAAMIPMQVYNTLQASKEASNAEKMSACKKDTLDVTVHGETPSSKDAADPNQIEKSSSLAQQEERMLKDIKQLIIGGGAIDDNLGQSLLGFPHAVWSTYGMTETLSHIALRRLSGAEASLWYTPFTHVGLSLSQDQTLVIDAPLVADEQLVTNDIVAFNELKQFRILGRKDNTINTGGIKVQIEEVENCLRPHLHVPFMITACSDAKFGQIVVMLLETDQESVVKEAYQALEQLPPFWRAKLIFSVPKLPLTGSGKPDRASAMRLAESHRQAKEQ